MSEGEMVVRYLVELPAAPANIYLQEQVCTDPDGDTMFVWNFGRAEALAFDSYEACVSFMCAMKLRAARCVRDEHPS